MWKVLSISDAMVLSIKLFMIVMVGVVIPGTNAKMEQVILILPIKTEEANKADILSVVDQPLQNLHYQIV
jgi:hypothetical protein